MRRTRHRWQRTTRVSKAVGLAVRRVAFGRVRAVGRCTRCALLLFSVGVGSPAFAQGQVLSTAMGTVIDGTTRAPVPGVLVTASAPTLQALQVAVTDADGFYRILQLPEGTYVLRFDKEGYEPYAQEDVVVKRYQPSELNVRLAGVQVRQESGVDGVEARSELVDITPEHGRLETNPFSAALPISPVSTQNGGLRSFSGLALVVPQSSASGFDRSEPEAPASRTSGLRRVASSQGSQSAGSAGSTGSAATTAGTGGAGRLPPVASPTP